MELKNIAASFALAAAMGAAFSVGAATYYLSPDGDDNNDGTSEMTAFKTVNKAFSKVHQTVHSWWTKKHPEDPQKGGGRGKIDPEGWNVCGLEWTPDAIVWTVNGEPTHSYRKVDDDPLKFPWTVPFYLMIDMQLGGEWVGEVDESALPVSLHVDWVKFYEGSKEDVTFREFVRPAQS